MIFDLHLSVSQHLSSNFFILILIRTDLNSFLNCMIVPAPSLFILFSFYLVMTSVFLGGWTTDAPQLGSTAVGTIVVTMCGVDGITDLWWRQQWLLGMVRWGGWQCVKAEHFGMVARRVWWLGGSPNLWMLNFWDEKMWSWQKMTGFVLGSVNTHFQGLVDPPGGGRGPKLFFFLVQIKLYVNY